MMFSWKEKQTLKSQNTPSMVAGASSLVMNTSLDEARAAIAEYHNSHSQSANDTLQPSTIADANSLLTSLGIISPTDAQTIISEYKKTGKIRADRFIKTKYTKAKKQVHKSRALNCLDHYVEWKRDICYIQNSLHHYASLQAHKGKAIEDMDTIDFCTETVHRIRRCLNNVYVDAKGYFSTDYRCKSFACPHCNYVKHMQKRKDFELGMLQLRDSFFDYNYSMLVTISTKHKPITVEECDEIIRSLNKEISSLLQHRRFKNDIVGTARTIEIIEALKSEIIRGAAHIHLHMLVLTRTKDIITRSTLSKRLNKRLKWSINVDVTEPIPKDKDFRSTLRDGFNYIHKPFGLKTRDEIRYNLTTGRHESSSSVRRQSLEFYVLMLQSIKGQRMVNTSGVIREACRIGKTQREIRKINALEDEALFSESSSTMHLTWHPHKRPTRIQGRTLYMDNGCYVLSKASTDQILNELHGQINLVQPTDSQKTDNSKDSTITAMTSDEIDKNLTGDPRLKPKLKVDNIPIESPATTTENKTTMEPVANPRNQLWGSKATLVQELLPFFEPRQINKDLS